MRISPRQVRHRVVGFGVVMLIVAACHHAPVITPGVSTVEAIPKWCLGAGGLPKDTASNFYACGTGESQDLQRAQNAALNQAVILIDRRLSAASSVAYTELERTKGVVVSNESQQRFELTANGIEHVTDSVKVVAVEGQGTYRAWILAHIAKQAWQQAQMRNLESIPGFDQLADSTRARLLRTATSGGNGVVGAPKSP
jgi:hypothetical protein